MQAPLNKFVEKMMLTVPITADDIRRAINELKKHYIPIDPLVLRAIIAVLDDYKAGLITQEKAPGLADRG